MYYTQTEPIYCPKQCCKFTLAIPPPYKNVQYTKTKIRKRKAGVFLYDSCIDKILLVQSRGDKWGFPKGTLEDNETVEECAIREVFEETGIKVSMAELESYTRLKVDKATYFYSTVESTQPKYQTLPEHHANNDATGLVWISRMCLVQCVNNGQMVLNSHCKKLLTKILKINF